MLSLYLKKNMPIVEDTYEIDEMYLGAKQRGNHGRTPALNHLVFGIFVQNTKK